MSRKDPSSFAGLIHSPSYRSPACPPDLPWIPHSAAKGMRIRRTGESKQANKNMALQLRHKGRLGILSCMTSSGFWSTSVQLTVKGAGVGILSSHILRGLTMHMPQKVVCYLQERSLVCESVE